MDCLSVDELAALAAEGPSSGGDDGVRHLRSCTDCARRLRDLQRQQEAITNVLAAWPPQPRPDCPDWELLAAYVEHGPGVEASVEAHLEECEYCLLQVARFRSAEESKRPALTLLSADSIAGPEKRSWLSMPGRGWLSLALVGSVAALCALGVFLNRRPQYTTLALSRPPAGLPPQLPAGHDVLPPRTAPSVPAPAPSTGKAQAQSESPQPLESAAPLYRKLPGARDSVRVFIRYSSAQQTVEAALPLADPLFLHSGDRFSLRVSGASARWLYIFQQDGRGAVSALFPSAGFQTGPNPVESNDRIIPSPGYDFRLDETTGLERIYLFYGPAPVDRCERLLGLAASGGSVDPEIGRILREMVKVADTGPRSALNYDAVRFSFQHVP